MNIHSGDGAQQGFAKILEPPSIAREIGTVTKIEGQDRDQVGAELEPGRKRRSRPGYGRGRARIGSVGVASIEEESSHGRGRVDPRPIESRSGTIRSASRSNRVGSRDRIGSGAEVESGRERGRIGSGAEVESGRGPRSN